MTVVAPHSSAAHNIHSTCYVTPGADPNYPPAPPYTGAAPLPDSAAPSLVVAPVPPSASPAHSYCFSAPNNQ